ncbi:MAG: glycosyltransferase [candidate division KSB1 bacterium]|jgi:glycosyltransferase involved in cell wall biosynthesis|nr:glycosyltransferase [candidate division KSB1 bacterium]
MKKVLMITYHFPPEGGPAVQRVTKFVKYMSAFGYQPIVLTAGGTKKLKDSSMLKDIPENTAVHRIPDPGRLFRGSLKKLFKRQFVPDKYAMWHKRAVHEAIRLIYEEKIDYIYSTSPPHSVQLIAERAAEKTGLPWVADFRDEWSADPSFSGSSFAASHKAMERSVIDKCDHLITITRTAADHFSTKISGDKVTFLPNGFDPDDFNGIEPGGDSSKGKLIIAYCGRLNRTHSPIPFFESLSSLLTEKKIAAEQVKIKIFGNPKNSRYLKSFPVLEKCVTAGSYVPHTACLSELSDSDALLLLATKMNWTQFLPAKMFEYFYLKKPILAIISGRGELNDALTDYGPVYVGYENDPESISRAMLQMYNDWKTRRLKRDADDAYVRRFNRKDQTGTLCEIFDQLKRGN